MDLKVRPVTHNFKQQHKRSTMTTEIYPRLEDSKILELEQESKLREQKWLIEHFIKPELPKIIETLGVCLEIITSKDEIKLPISSARTEQVKGIVTRCSSELTDLDIKLHLKSLSKKIHLKLNESIELTQLTEMVGLINQIMSEVQILKDCPADEIKQFVKQLNRILQNLIKCNVVLNKPDEHILFPKHKIQLDQVFEPNGQKLQHYQDRLTIDFFILNSEISIEFKSLEKVTESPWNQIDPSGKSHVDKLREDLKHHKIKLNDILDQDKKKIGHVLGLNRFSTNDYLTRSITFNHNVVIEVEKLLIHCQDPNLISIGAKLTGLEHLVSKMYGNLDMSMM